MAQVRGNMTQVAVAGKLISLSPLSFHGEEETGALG